MKLINIACWASFLDGLNEVTVIKNLTSHHILNALLPYLAKYVAMANEITNFAPPSRFLSVECVESHRDNINQTVRTTAQIIRLVVR